MALSVRFDPTGPYDVDAADAPFARPAGMELLARLYRAAGHPADARRVLEEAVTILDERNREPIYSMRVPAHRGIDCPAALTYEQILALRAAD